uniref:Sushi domain-containing protein n=1 Tax=Buteo japonicus TaxID=224669 RepID=A0A8C0ARK6_9AVES
DMGTQEGWCDVTCEPPPEIAGGKVQGVKKSRYLPAESARYQCWQGFEMTGTATVTCRNGTWTVLPKCKGKGGKCGPPPVIENGDLLSFPMQEYRQGTTLEYKCPSLYVLEGSRYITCTDGQWTSPPVCLGRLKHVLGGQRPCDCSCCLFLRSQGHHLYSSPCAGAAMPVGQNGSESFFCPEGVSS